MTAGKSFIRKIPGFRSGTWWKMILAVLGYGFIILVLLGIIMGSPESPSPSIPATRTQTQSPIISTGFDLIRLLELAYLFTIIGLKKTLMMGRLCISIS
jgi:hypothetical protein